MTRLRRAVQAAFSGLALALAACGGGSTTTIIIEPGALGKQWRGTLLSDLAIALVPGGGHALVGDAPEVDWMAYQVPPQSNVDLRQAAYASGGWQTVPTPRASGVHNRVFTSGTAMARAGDWTVMVTRDVDVDSSGNRNIWGQLMGPGGAMSAVLSQPVTSDGGVHVVVDVTGKARIYWSNTNGSVTKVYAMHFDSGMNGVFDGEVTNMSLDLLGTVAGPDGKGWLFYPYAGRHYMRTVDAASGLGTAVLLDEAALGAVQPLRRALAETATRLSTLAVQNAGGGSPCVGVRRLDSATLSATTCVNGARTDVGTRIAELAVEPGGRALVVWSGGTSDHALYGALRQADGTWSAPSVVATVPSGFHAATVTAKIHTDGSAVVVYRQADGALPDPQVAENAVPYAVGWDATTGGWSAATRIDTDNGASARLTMAFNSRGEPGVLNFADAGTTGAYRVRFATRRNGKWTAASLQDNANLAKESNNNVTRLVSMQRLVPQGDGGWVAFWELTTSLPPGYGHQVIAAAYQ